VTWEDEECPAWVLDAIGGVDEEQAEELGEAPMAESSPEEAVDAGGDSFGY
jgi:hypothetical protein